MSASVRSAPGAPAVGWSGARTVTIDRSKEGGGMGLGFNGGELLLLALAACFTNDLHREARRRGIELRSVHVDASATFPAEGAPGEDVRYDVEVDAAASEAEVRALVEATDKVAEIHNTLRVATLVKLGRVLVKH
ncbi:MAG TPA: OsmC family protein [Candidatus Thermoplasmatota archaeon]|nr:OsmC family protein [Candidatus Thermoplasmatota archaeon]